MSGKLIKLQMTVDTVKRRISVVAMEMTAVQKGDNKKAVALLFITLLCAGAFLVNKYFEWGHKIHIGLYPGSDLMLTLNHGSVMFFSLYYFMTGLHVLHLIIGAIVLTVVMVKVNGGSINKGDYVLLENGGLYWHLVDLSALTVLVALLIASVKAYIVLAYFMHLKFESSLFRVLVIVVLSIYALVIGLTFFDYLARL